MEGILQLMDLFTVLLFIIRLIFGWYAYNIPATDLLHPLNPSPSLGFPLRDRMMLLKLEQDILEFINDDK